MNKHERRESNSKAIAEFLANGGKITKCPTKTAGQRMTKKERVEAEIDYSALPKALKIRLGIKE